MLGRDNRWQCSIDLILRGCLGLSTLQMAQTRLVETRLRTILRAAARRQAPGRRSVAAAALATLVVVTFLAALKPPAWADGPPRRPAKAQDSEIAAPIREKQAFARAVHAYNIASVRLYTGLAQCSGEYEQAVNRKRPEKIAVLLMPGYTLNGEPTPPGKAIALLRSQIQKYGGGYRLVFRRAEAKSVPLKVPAGKTARALSVPAVPSTVTTTGIEYWHRDGRKSLGLPVASRRDVWIMTPHGLKLASTETRPLISRQ